MMNIAGSKVPEMRNNIQMVLKYITTCPAWPQSVTSADSLHKLRELES